VSPIEAFTRTRTTRWSVWKFNWLVNHKLIHALEHARPHARGTLLDVGCGTKAFARCFDGRLDRYLGVDLPGSRYLDRAGPDAYARGEALPVRDRAVETVLCLSVLTYLTEPARLIEEAHRVLRPGGALLMEFTQMAPLHDPPHDYFRFTRFGASFLLERAGFEVVELVPIGGLWARVGLSTIAVLNRLNRGPTRVLTELPVRVLYVVLQLLFELLDRMFFDPCEVLSHLAIARRRDAGEPPAAGAAGRTPARD
jgi:SAM-dependent methyltransferase